MRLLLGIFEDTYGQYEIVEFCRTPMTKYPHYQSVYFPGCHLSSKRALLHLSAVTYSET